MSTRPSIQHDGDGPFNPLVVIETDSVEAHFFLLEAMRPEDVELVLKDVRLSEILAHWSQAPKNAVISLVANLTETAGHIAELCIAVEQQGLRRSRSASQTHRAKEAVAKARASWIGL